MHSESTGKGFVRRNDIMPVWRKEHEVARVVVNYIGIVSTAVCGIPVIGQLFNKPFLYSWGKYGSMSLPTALVCTAFGVAFYLVSRGEATYVSGGAR